jgi:hypothetical protein
MHLFERSSYFSSNTWSIYSVFSLYIKNTPRILTDGQNLTYYLSTGQILDAHHVELKYPKQWYNFYCTLSTAIAHRINLPML